jgi:hypothetical protein
MEPKDIVKDIATKETYKRDREACPGLHKLKELHVEDYFLPNHKEWLVEKFKRLRQTGSSATKSGRKARRAQIKKQLDREGLDAAARDTIKQIMRQRMPSRQKLCDAFLLCHCSYMLLLTTHNAGWSPKILSKPLHSIPFMSATEKSALVYVN